MAKEYSIEELEIMLNEKKKSNKKSKLADKLVPFVVIVNILFGATILIIFYKTGLEPSTLIERWFKFFGYELLAMAGIQIANVVGEHFGGDK